jgi:hypothetical protein
MPKRLSILFFTLIAAILWVGKASAQATDTVPMVAKGYDRSLLIGLSASAYRGNLSPSYRTFKPGLQLGLRFQRRKRLNGKAELSISQIEGGSYFQPSAQGSDRMPNTYFKSTLVSLSYQLQLNLINTNLIRWYLGAGFGLLRYDPKDENGTRLLTRNSTRAIGETYSNITVMLPLNVGVEYKLNNRVALGLQAGWVNGQSSYLDNISKLSSSTGGGSGNDNVLSYQLNLSVGLERK